MPNEHNDQTSEANKPPSFGRAVIVGSVIVLGTAVLVGLIVPVLRKPLAAAVIASPFPPIP